MFPFWVLAGSCLSSILILIKLEGTNTFQHLTAIRSQNWANSMLKTLEVLRRNLAKVVAKEERTSTFWGQFFQQIAWCIWRFWCSNAIMQIFAQQIRCKYTGPSFTLDRFEVSAKCKNTSGSRWQGCADPVNPLIQQSSGLFRILLKHSAFNFPTLRSWESPMWDPLHESDLGSAQAQNHFFIVFTGSKLHFVKYMKGKNVSRQKWKIILIPCCDQGPEVDL